MFISLTYIVIFSIITKIAFSLKEKGSFRRFSGVDENRLKVYEVWDANASA